MIRFGIYSLSEAGSAFIFRWNRRCEFARPVTLYWYTGQKQITIMNEELQKKHRQESSAILRRILVIGLIKLISLSVISAFFVYWYMY